MIINFKKVIVKVFQSDPNISDINFETQFLTFLDLTFFALDTSRLKAYGENPDKKTKLFIFFQSLKPTTAGDILFPR